MKSYCPVLWTSREELHWVSNFDHVAEYYGMTYKLSSPKTLAMFLENPDKYLEKVLPDNLPKSLTTAEASEIRDTEIFM